MKKLQPSLQVIFDAVEGALDGPESISRRLFHGRGRTFPRLEFITVDLFLPVLLVTLFRDPEKTWLGALLEGLRQLARDTTVECIVVQRRVNGLVASEVIQGSLPSEQWAREQGLRYEIELLTRQNVGFFLDMQPGRQWLRKQACGKKVLNLFAYTCAFSVAAQAGGAREVVNLDMSSRALATGRRNHLINFPHSEVSDKILFRDFEILRSVGWLAKRGPFDIVVIDPPSYQPGSFIASKDYARLIRRLPRMVQAGSLILACLNARNLSSEFLLESFAEHFPAAEFIERLPNSPDFPDIDKECSLKLMLFQVGMQGEKSTLAVDAAKHLTA